MGEKDVNGGDDGDGVGDAGGADYAVDAGDGTVDVGGDDAGDAGHPLATQPSSRLRMTEHV